LHQQLKKAVMVDRRVWAEDLVAHFHKNLSFKKIARELDRICHKTLSTNKSGF
jgi:hypothetical protein